MNLALATAFQPVQEVSANDRGRKNRQSQRQVNQSFRVILVHVIFRASMLVHKMRCHRYIIIQETEAAQVTVKRNCFSGSFASRSNCSVSVKAIGTEFDRMIGRLMGPYG